MGRRVWITNFYEGVCSSDFIRSNLVEDIKKRIIMNGMTGSSWRFKRFDRVYITVNSNDVISVGD